MVTIVAQHWHRSGPTPHRVHLKEQLFDPPFCGLAPSHRSERNPHCWQVRGARLFTEEGAFAEVLGVGVAVATLRELAPLRLLLRHSAASCSACWRSRSRAANQRSGGGVLRFATHCCIVPDMK